MHRPASGEPGAVARGMELRNRRLAGKENAVVDRPGEFQALVPTWAVDEDRTFVVAARVGRVNGKILVYLPVSNEGRPAWELTDEEYAQVATVEEIP